MKLKLTSLLFASALLTACGGENAESTPESAQNTEAVSQSSELKKKALEACNAQIEQVPEEMKEQAAEICVCTVEKMDYEKLEELTMAGKTQEAMKLSVETAQKCNTDS